jgi:hypothetical protein
MGLKRGCAVAIAANQYRGDAKMTGWVYRGTRARRQMGLVFWLLNFWILTGSGL